jgi:isopentenyldiphosphate isomerase
MAADDYNSQDELLAVVNERDEETGAEPRWKVHAEGLMHRAAHVLVFDASGLLVIQKRSGKKDTFPDHWECVGGHMAPGETYEDAAQREVKEELGVEVSSLVRIGKTSARPESGMEFIEIYTAVAAGPVQPNPDEVTSTDALSLEELRDEVASGARRFSPVFVNTLRHIGLLM